MAAAVRRDGGVVAFFTSFRIVQGTCDVTSRVCVFSKEAAGSLFAKITGPFSACLRKREISLLQRDDSIGEAARTTKALVRTLPQLSAVFSEREMLEVLGKKSSMALLRSTVQGCVATYVWNAGPSHFWRCTNIVGVSAICHFLIRTEGDFRLMERNDYAIENMKSISIAVANIAGTAVGCTFFGPIGGAALGTFTTFIATEAYIFYGLITESSTFQANKAAVIAEINQPADGVP